jgi:hypothetical protein
MAKPCHRRLSPRCLLGRLGGDLVPKRYHRRFSRRCLLGCLKGDLVPKRCHRRPSPRCLLGRLRGDLAPKRCHRRPSPRCLLGRLRGDVMPKPCHRRLSLRCLPLSRHLPTHSAHSFLAHGQRHPQRLRPADTCRQALHVPGWGTVRAMLGISAQPTLADTLGTLLPLMAIIPPSVPSAINRTVSPTVDKSGEALASPAARNPSHALASRGEIRRASRP